MNKNVKEGLLYIRKYIGRNNKILNQYKRKVKTNKVNLHWWSMQQNNGDENIGDLLSVIIVQYMLKKKGLSLDASSTETKHLYGVGSIIQGGAHNATIWGSGLKSGKSILPTYIRKTRKLDVRLVRGPLTREYLCRAGYNCGKNYGDPAIIMPLIYKPEEQEKKDYGVILHHASKRKVDGSIMLVGKDYREFLDYIYNSKLIISSSLHGVILAEAYGVPAVLLTDGATENIFKYRDYYASTGRTNFNIANTIEEALTMRPNEIPNFKEMQEVIQETFPYDLWN